MAPGVYVAADGPARLLLVKGDAWRFLAACPPRVCDLILTDLAVKMGTSKHLGAGTTKATARSREGSYARRDLDETWLREAFRVLKSERAWARQGGGETTGGGALVVILPAETRTTWPHIRRLIGRAEKCGFTYYGRATWVHRRGLGYDMEAVPEGDRWVVRVVEAKGAFALSVRKPGGARFYPNEVVEKLLGAPATTRDWSTMVKVAKLLE